MITTSLLTYHLTELVFVCVCYEHLRSTFLLASFKYTKQYVILTIITMLYVCF